MGTRHEPKTESSPFSPHMSSNMNRNNFANGSTILKVARNECKTTFLSAHSQTVVHDNGSLLTLSLTLNPSAQAAWRTL